MLKLMYITNNPRIARIAVDSGVDRIFVDLEILGKEERQGNMDTVKSHHTFSDIVRIKEEVKQDADVLVRINPFYQGTEYEIEKAISCGADILMLPMWKTVWEVERFVNAVAGRARTIALLETKEADACLDEVLKIEGLDEIHIGLNDLHLSYHRQFLFELLADGTVDRICAKIARSGKDYGFGGVGRIGFGMLPAEYILTEHHRLGSSAVILSRSFCNASTVTDYATTEINFRRGVEDIRNWEKRVRSWKPGALMQNHLMVGHCVDQILEQKRGK